MNSPISSQHHSFDIRLAAIYGVECALLIHHFQHWIRINRFAKRNIKEGRCWSYQTRKEIQAHFPYWSFEQVKYGCEKLVDHGVLVTSNFNRAKMDKTLWYAFANESEFGVDEESSKKFYERENSLSKGKIPSSKGKIPQAIPDTITYSKTTDSSPSSFHSKESNTPPNPLKRETSAKASLSEEFSLNSSRTLIEDSLLVANSSNSGTYKSANLSYVVSEGDEADKLKRKVQEDSLNLANYLFERITLLKPDFKKPDLKKWGNDLRLAMEQDGRSLGSLKEVIESATQEIDQLQYYASAGSIRRNFDKLQVKSAVFKKETLKRRNKEFALQTKETHPANLQSLIITKDYACNKSNSKEIRLDLDQNTFRIRLLEIFNGTYTGEII